MLFHCVTACLNAENLIADTMYSVLNQSALKLNDCFLRYTIIDGNSSDNTLNIIHRISSEFAKIENIKINICSESDRGLYDALAKGFRDGEGCDIHSYLNAGDIYSEYAYEIVKEIFSEKNISFLTGMNFWYNKNNHVVKTELPFLYNKRLVKMGFYGRILPFIQQESTFWNSNLHQSIDLDKLKTFKYAGDFFLWYSFIEQSELYTVSAWLSGFKIHDNQISSESFIEYVDEIKAIADKPNLLDYFFAYFYKLLFYLPKRIKYALDSRLFVYDSKRNTYNLLKKTNNKNRVV